MKKKKQHRRKQMTNRYDPLDDALALIGKAMADDEVTDEDLLSMLHASSEDHLEELVLTLTGMAAGLALSIADGTAEPGNAVLLEMGATRPEATDAADHADGSV